MSVVVCLCVCAANLSASVYPSIIENEPFYISSPLLYYYTGFIQGDLFLTEEKLCSISTNTVVRAIETVHTEVGYPLI